MLDIVKSFGLIDALDIMLISFLIYRLLLLLKGTRAIHMVIGILLLLVVSFASKYFGLKTTAWVLSNFTGYLFLMIVILFQPEIRRALAFIGETKFFGGTSQSVNLILDELVKTASILANRQIGALIVLERGTDLEKYLEESGQKIGARLSKDLLISIFIPYSPLHDGAVIVSGGQIITAGSILPLTKKIDIGKGYGTRHRAALGITEETDAVCIVVSEEKGSITVAMKGELTQELDGEMLRQKLKDIFKKKRNGGEK